MVEEWQECEGFEVEEGMHDKDHGNLGQQLDIGSWLDHVPKDKGRMLSCTRRYSHAAHVEGVMGVLIGDIACRHILGCSAVEVVGVRGIEMELVDGRYWQLVGRSEVPGVVGEVVDEQTEMVVVRIVRHQGCDQSSPSGRLEEEVHVLEEVKENTAGMVVDNLPAVAQDRVHDCQDYRCATVLYMGRGIAQQLDQAEHNRPQQHRRNLHRICPPVFSYAHHCAFGQSGELLRTEDSELGRLDLQSPVERGIGSASIHDLRLAIAQGFCIAILIRLLCLLVQIETEAIFALVANGKIWEDKVSSLGGSIKIGHARDGHPCQDWDLRRWWLWKTTMRSDDTRHFQRGKEEEVGIIRECDIFLVLAFSLVDAKLDNGRWINRPSISRCWT
jgi:hypothetical protein